MELTAQLLSIQVGQPVTYPAEGLEGKEWRSAINKTPVAGPVWLRELGLEGDRQTDLHNHGGPFRAVNVYPSEHYDLWHQTPGLEGMSGGAFGENFTTRGLLETTACIGDVFSVGEAIVELTQPRRPCYKLNRRWHNPDIQQRAETTGFIGWYLRVRQPGRVAAGQTLTLLERPFPEWTVAQVWSLRMNPVDAAAIRQLLEVPALPEDWKSSLRKKVG